MPDDLLAPDRRHPSILPLVVHCGRGRWTAAEDMAAAADANDPLAAEFLPRRSYATLNAMALGRKGTPERNRMGVYARVRAGKSPKRMMEEVRRSFEWIGEDEYHLRTALLDWMHANCEGMDIAPEVRRQMAELETEEEAEMLADTINRWNKKQTKQADKRGHKRGLAQGRKQGIEQGREEVRDLERGLLRRLAERRFGAEAGDGVAALLAGVADQSRLERVGDLIVECTSRDELLARLNGRPRA